MKECIRHFERGSPSTVEAPAATRVGPPQSRKAPRSKKRVWSETHKRYSWTREGTFTDPGGLQIAGLLTANGFTAVPDARLSNFEFHCRAIRRVSPRWCLHLGAQGGYPHRTACPACSARSKCLEVSARRTVDHFANWRLLTKVTMSEQSREIASSSPGVLR